MVMTVRGTSNHVTARALTHLGVKTTHVYIGQLRNGERDNPTLRVLQALATHLHTTIGWLIGEEPLTTMSLPLDGLSSQSLAAVAAAIHLARRADGLTPAQPLKPRIVSPPTSERAAIAAGHTHPFPATQVQLALHESQHPSSNGIGQRLHTLRETADMTLDQAGHAIGATADTVARIETGHLRPSAADLATLLNLYGVTNPQHHSLLHAIARGDYATAWWRHYIPTMPLWVLTLLAYEDTADIIRGYSSTGVPPLLQTENYARAARYAAHYPDLVPEQVELAVQLILERQIRPIEHETAHLWLIVHEAALMDTVGGIDVQIEQINHLIDVSKRRNVTLQVNRMREGRYRPRGSSFTLLQFPGSTPSVVFTPQLVDDHLIEAPEQTAAYLIAHTRLSLSAQQAETTVDVLTEIRDRLTRDNLSDDELPNAGKPERRTGRQHQRS
ncbi:Scr1 family TA system antitoxin-like transcriptional regulator [Nonomuraea polychroma]|uniref:Scr1 family TA system antitoxin-like transcriptional regulator n=1 Tax=Nonomuraea polychroma TaxID=46176 RepID=UPI003D8AFB36